LYFIVPAIIIVTVSTVTIQAIKHKSNWIFPWEQLNQLKSKTLPAYNYKYNCQYTLFDVKAYNEDHCVYPENTNKANAFLIGDSNAAHYLGMLRVFAEHYGFGIRNATQSDCPMVFDNDFNWIRSKFKRGCSIYSHSVFMEAKKYDTVIVGGIWKSYYAKKKFKESFEKTIDQLSKNVQHIILLGQVPIFPNYNKECAVRSIRLNALECSILFNNRKTEHISNQFLRTIANKYNNVEYFDVRNQLCHSGECTPYLGGNPVYFDGAHFSMKGSAQIGTKMIEQHDPMLKVFENINKGN